MTYNPGQFKHLTRCLPTPPAWVILGGPADGDDALTCLKKWPAARLIGVEPCFEMIHWQRRHGWPPGHPLLPYALSDQCGHADLHLPATAGARTPPDDVYAQRLRGSTLMEDRGGTVTRVPTITVESIEDAYGPFESVALWLDIEGWEYQALTGAERLFRAGKVVACNVEILERRTEATGQIEAFFTRHGFQLAHTWNEQRGLCEDRVYVRGAGQ